MDTSAIENWNRSLDVSNDINQKRCGASDLVCLVCSAPSTGFNFSVITCMCCKAFFRRNALGGLEAHQCRYRTEKCSINMRTRRDCSYCRLKKCFQVGMKKELIMTEDVKRIKREKLSANRQMTLTLIKRTNCLNENDSIYLRNISNAYEEYCRLPIMTYEKHEYDSVCHQPIRTRVKFHYYMGSFEKHQSSLFTFLQQLPDLQQFSNTEQKELLAHNVRFLMKVNSIETMNDNFPIWGAVNLLLEIMYGKFLVQCLDECLHQFKYSLNDPRCTQLFLVILFFSTSNRYTGHVNTLLLHKIQEKYTVLLWTYLKERHGEDVAYQKFSVIIRYCLRLQTICHLMDLQAQDIQQQQLIHIPKSIDQN